jgi:hypothetical protein
MSGTFKVTLQAKTESSSTEAATYAEALQVATGLFEKVKEKGYQTVWASKAQGQIKAACLTNPKTGATVSVGIAPMEEAQGAQNE